MSGGLALIEKQRTVLNHVQGVNKPSVSHKQLRYIHGSGPQQCWQRVHIDYAGPFLDKMFLVVVDAYSKWPEVFPVKNATSVETIDVLRTLFAHTGLPQQLVSNGGSQFTSEDFQLFTKKNGIKHITTVLFHPATNGLAERFVQTFKESLKAMGNTKMSISEKPANFLLLSQH